MPTHPNDIPIDTDLSPDDSDVCTAKGFKAAFNVEFNGPGIYHVQAKAYQDVGGTEDPGSAEIEVDVIDTLIVMPEGVNTGIWNQTWPDDTQFVVFVYYNRNPMSLFGMLGSAPMRVPATE